MFWRNRKAREAARADTADARATRQQQEALKRDSEHRLEITRATVIEPLRRTRRQMIEHNHVTDAIVRYIREGGD